MNQRLLLPWLCFLLGSVVVGCNPGVYLDPCPDGGMVVNGVCQAKDCATRQCPDGFICQNDQCVAFDCLKVQCPADLVCSSGHCYPKDCQARNCPSPGDVCVDNECRSQGCASVTCPQDQVCANGQCYPTDCGAKPCPNQGEVCVNGVCVEPSCVGVQCPANQGCAAGVCYPLDCNQLPCNNDWEVCVDGICQRRNCVNVQCPAGQVCANGSCYPKDCAGKTCGYGEACDPIQGCVPVACAGVQCPSGELCAGGECFPSSCGSNPCPANYVCYNKQCTQNKCAGVQCPAGQACADGQCIAQDCTSLGCAPTEVCVGGVCVPADCAHLTCPAGQACAEGPNTGPTCYPKNCGATTCGNFEVCVNGVCTDQLCLGVTCGANQVCVAGTCHDLDCTSPCAADEVCENGRCVLKDCAGARCCPPSRCDNTDQCTNYTCPDGVYTCLFDGATSTPAWSTTGTTCTDNDPCTIQDNCQGAICKGIPMPCDTGETCVAGVCRCGGTGPDCVNGETCCGTNCYDLNTNLDNCGNCGTLCRRGHATPQCQSGNCSIQQCDALWGNCNGIDADGCETSLETLTDCKSCSTPCSAPGATTSCVGGTCHITNCGTLLGDCDGNLGNGCESSLETLTNCGACNTPCSRANATPSCTGGNCHIQACINLWANCNGTDADGCEVSLETTTNCGSCNTPCGRPNAQASCVGGSCHIGNCNPLWANCDGNDANGCETDLTTLTNCGVCNQTCSRNNAQASCAGGNCQIGTCNSLWGNCDGNDANGCERATNTLTDCGTCNQTCSLANASASCTTGTCLIASCNSLWGNCDGTDADGCETDLTTLSNCGSCNIPCSRANATATCAGGSCHIGSCNALFQNCNGLDPDGCETSLQTLTDCGACGTPCSRANATASCAGGSCHIGSCNSLWGNCDGNDANGCEMPINTLTDCGGCGVGCSRSNASATCATGSCQIASCNGGWGNCDGIDANGCEATLNTLQNCGACANPCSRANATATCATGSCLIASCNSLWGNCNGIDSDGCETSLQGVNNCNGCGVICSRANATPSCAGGTCQIGSCNSLWGNCDGNDADGCERPLNTLSDCGACNQTCSLANANPTCVSGSCQISSCISGWANCNGIQSDGCETQLGTNSNCAGCGDACTFANGSGICISYACTLQSCNAGYWNIDGVDANGCECADTSDTPDTCAAAQNVGTVSSGNPNISVNGVIAYRTGYHQDQDCYSVAYSSPADGSGTFQISLSGTNLTFSVWRGNCSTSECASEDTSYSTNCTSLGPICETGNSATFYVCVHNAIGTNNVCSAYTLTFSWS